MEPTYNPKTLARTSNLASDIAFLLQCQEATWQSHPAHTGLLLSRPDSFIAYTERLQTLSHSADPSLLLAHAYVRYLGDLSGGQVIRRRVAQAYAIDAENGSGVKFYEFKNLEGTKPGTRGDNKKIKEWYRTGMNAGVRDNETLKSTRNCIRSHRISQSSNSPFDFKAAILEEANKAFELNLNLFDSLKGPTPYTKHLYGSTVSLLGDLESDIDEDAMDSPPSQPKELPIEIIQGNHQERMVSFASVLSVIVAVCLAHFLLVTCGFTGEKWLQKLESLGISVL